MEIALTKEDATEVLYKLTALAETEELCEEYGLTEDQATTLRDSVPANGGNWMVPEWGEIAARAEMADHCDVLASISADARSGGEIGQSLRIAKQAHRLGRLFA